MLRAVQMEMFANPVCKWVQNAPICSQGVQQEALGAGGLCDLGFIWQSPLYQGVNLLHLSINTAHYTELELKLSHIFW